MKFKCINHTFTKSLFPNSSTQECFSTHGIDEYTFSHLFAGIGVKIIFPDIKNYTIVAIPIVWEYIETKDFIKKIFNIGSGIGSDILRGSKKDYNGDSIINSISDILFFIIGYNYSNKKKLHKKYSKEKTILWYIIISIICGIVSLKRFNNIS